MKSNVIEFTDDKDQIETEAWQWLIKFEGDTPPSTEDITALNNWSQQSPLHKETLSRIAKGWHSLDLLSELVMPEASPPQAGSSFMATVLLGLLSPFILLASVSGRAFNNIGELFRSPVLLVSSTTIVSGVMAAWLFMPLVLSALITWQAPGEGSFKTSVGEQSSFKLADGSTLWLNTNSQVVLEFTDSSRRINLLSGEAHFDVSHNPERPFEVYVDDKIVRAVGTAFSVFLEEKNIQVMVTEGRVQLGVISPVTAIADVQLAQQTLPPGTVSELSAGQKITIAGDGPNAIPAVTEYTTTELNRKMAWLNGELIYTGEALGVVIKEISRYTPVTIELVDPELAAIRIGGQFQVGQTEALFEILEIGFGLKISRLSASHVQVHAQ